MKARIARTIVSDTLSQIINLASRVITIPLFISNYGAIVYGEWVTIIALTGWLSFADFGGQLYFVNQMTIYSSQDDFKSLQRTYTTGLYSFIFSSVVLFAIFSFIAAMTPFISYFKISALGDEQAKLVLFIITLKLFLDLPGGILYGLYRAIGKQATSLMWQNLSAITTLATTLIILSAKLPLVDLALTEFASALFVYLLACIYIRSFIPQDFTLFSVKFFCRKELAIATSPSFHFLLIQLSSLLSVQGSVLLISHLLGSYQVAVYSTVKVIASLVSRCVGIVSHAVWPEITRLYSLNEKLRLLKLIGYSNIISFVIGSLYIVALSNYGQQLIHMWISGKLQINSQIIVHFSLISVLVSITSIFYNLLMATNSHRISSLVTLVATVVGILLQYLLGSQFSLTGIFYGQLVSLFLIPFASCIYLMRRYSYSQLIPFYLFSIFTVFLLFLNLLPSIIEFALIIFSALLGFTLFNGKLLLQHNCYNPK